MQVILRADKTTNNFSDRAILKNLGHWLGMQTLAKNKPILQKVREGRVFVGCMCGGVEVWRCIWFEFLMQDLAVKDLVREAHYKGEKVVNINMHDQHFSFNYTLSPSPSLPSLFITYTLNSPLSLSLFLIHISSNCLSLSPFPLPISFLSLSLSLLPSLPSSLH